MKVALAGNQNCGKTTLFNLLTGLNQKIGNWPGVTVERKSGIIKNTDIEINDIPGIYSLSPYTLEEDVTRKYLFNEKPDLIINIIDATALERSLYLTTQLCELDCGIILALNMIDLAEKKGIKINVENLEKRLRLKIIPISAVKNTGVDKLLNEIKNYPAGAALFPAKILLPAAPPLENLITNIQKNIDTPHKRFAAVKILEGDKEFKHLYGGVIPDYDYEQAIASYRYGFIEKAVSECVAHSNKRTVNDALDKIFLHKIFALPVFALVMVIVYYLAAGVGGRLTAQGVEGLIILVKESTEEYLVKTGASHWTVSLVCDGILEGVGAVVAFVPQLIILFLLISLLENSGYMSRIAFIFDRLLNKLGLSGKSLIAFIVGTGCSVPGIMTVKTLEDKSEREQTAVLTPFIPCSAKLPVISLFAGYFFHESAGLITVSLYFASVIIIIFSAFLMKKFIYKTESGVFISELPDYKIPSAKYVLRDVFDRTLSFLKRAGTVIMLASVVLWFMLSFSIKLEYGVEINKSILARLGGLIAWIFYPMLGTYSWEAAVSALQGLIAKEQVVSSMAIISGFTDGALADVMIFNSTAFSFFTPVSAYAFMVFNLFSAPCVAAISAMRKELLSARKMLYAIIYQTFIALFLSYLVYFIGNLF